MKRVVATLITLCALLNFTACNIKNDAKTTNIDLSFYASDLTPEEYESVGVSTIDNPTKDDFKNLHLVLSVENMSNRTIKIPDINKVLKDEGILWFGNSTKQDNESENFACYQEDYVIFVRNLSDDAIKAIFEKSEVNVSWITSEGKEMNSVSNLSEIIEFK